MTEEGERGTEEKTKRRDKVGLGGKRRGERNRETVQLGGEEILPLF